jgi:hypothetical protein
LTIGPGAASLLTPPLRAAAAKPAGGEGTRARHESAPSASNTYKEKNRMTRTNSTLGLLAAVAFCFCAFGAANASAEGVTLHECTEVEPTSTAGRFSDSECTEEAGEGEYATTPISGIKNVKATNTGNFTLTANAFGVHVVITCTGMVSHGTAQNGVNPENGEMTVDGEAGNVTYTGCSLAQEPGLEGCSVPTTLTTNAVKSMSEGMSVKYTPKEGEVFIEIPLESCGLLNGKKKVKGSAKS